MTGNAADLVRQWDNQEKRLRDPYEVLWDKRKPLLPELPDTNDFAGQCAWLTSVLHLDRRRPVTKAYHQGHAGSNGHVVIARLNAQALRFEPASKLSDPKRLADELVWQLLPDDGEPYPWATQQTVKIARIVRLLCGSTASVSADQQTELVINTFLDSAVRVEGRTHGTAAQRFEAAALLRPDMQGQTVFTYRYLVDLDTDEIIIRVSDLTSMTRRVLGGTIAHGWLDARMENLGWQRRTLSGYSLPGRHGRREGGHARTDIYRGVVRGEGVE